MTIQDLNPLELWNLAVRQYNKRIYSLSEEDPISYIFYCKLLEYYRLEAPHDIARGH